MKRLAPSGPSVCLAGEVPGKRSAGRERPFSLLNKLAAKGESEAAAAAAEVGPVADNGKPAAVAASGPLGRYLLLHLRSVVNNEVPAKRGENLLPWPTTVAGGVVGATTPEAPNKVPAPAG